jgi:hypothetical protein
MKPIQFTLALLVVVLVALPLSDAWKLQMWDKDNYKGTRLHYRTGLKGQPCKTLPSSTKNRANSLKWTENIPCEARFYNGDKCAGVSIMKTGFWCRGRGTSARTATRSTRTVSVALHKWDPFAPARNDDRQ